jgi:formate hydrogenlyase transcriptional activator
MIIEQDRPIINGVARNFYRTLLEVTNVLNSQRNTEGLWKAITGHIKTVIPWERAGITLYHPDLDAFRFYAVETSLPVVRLKSDAIIPREGSGMGWVYDHHRLHIRPFIQHRPVFLEDAFYKEEGLGRMINLPMLVGDSCIGSLNIGSVEAGEPDPDNVEFLRQVATQIAFAIDHVRAYEEITCLKECLTRENAYLMEEIKVNHNFGAMVGNSQKFKKVLDLAQAVAPTTTSVLIMGETGTGKELLARLIHELSPRKQKPFVRVNCAALPSGLVESELFGHEKGAFTGAEQGRPGKFELANGGTLFLDEIGEMPIEAQAKLLRVLQDGIVERVGSIGGKDVDVRIIAATNTDLSKGLAEGRFRSDLYYRLYVFPLVVPPLRERLHDIPLLVRHFMEKYRLQFRRNCQEIDEQSMDRLIQYPWPGNVRELKNVIERAMILSNSSVVHVEESLLRSPGDEMTATQPTQLKDLERVQIQQALHACDWRIDGPLGAAKHLGLNPSTLRSRLKKLGIKRNPNNKLTLERCG